MATEFIEIIVGRAGLRGLFEVIYLYSQTENEACGAGFR